MAVRIAKKEDKRAFYSIEAYCFNMGNASIENNVSSDNFRHEEVLVNEVNNKIMQCLHVVPFEMNFDNNKYLMGGIAGVASLPESRDQGGIKELLTYSLEYMKERNMMFSALGPFSCEFYRKYGWEWAFSWQKLKFNVQHLKNTPKTYKYCELTKENDDLIEDFREKFISSINGPITHTPKIRNERWEKFKNNFYHCYGAYNENNELEAIAIYYINGKCLYCDELYYLSETGRQHILHFFYTHRSQVEEIELTLLKDDNLRLVLPTPRIQYWEWANMMFRVVMVKETLEAMKINNKIKGSFTLKVNDNQASWNNKVFKITAQNGKLLVVETNLKKANIEVSIQRLSQLIIGFIGGNEAIDLELVNIFNTNKIELFKSIFLKRKTMLWQMF